ncbi:Deoxycytidylate deaminase [Nitrosospira multiformis]|uniref:Deoxycytidylate deaminase n=1 Tax=Nitrosospira multiformis TaxID=1231 RepID=A0A1I0GAF7_9PROT|nr:anti-phage dCTP deaminase [Nitrosospira multiformis]SET67787.1 Deoxycytidylate deaminase [Nitrosospira multiformis]
MSISDIKSALSAIQINRDDQTEVKIPKLNERLTEEFVIALVGPVGSGCTKVAELLTELFGNDYEYIVHNYKLSDYIADNATLVGKEIKKGIGTGERIKQMQAIGDELRRVCGKSYLAAKAVEKIAEKRDTEGLGKTIDGQLVPKQFRRLHIIDSLKHPEELKLLRATYGDIFWLIGVFAPLTVREQRLEFQEHLDKAQIEAIIRRDYSEEEDYGQKVRGVFYQADYFVRNDQENTNRLKQGITRFVEIIFGASVHTPTTDESSMYAAYAEAAKSACLSRQVGAAIVSINGELIGSGRNDVPRFGGGLYSEDDGENDHRCHAWMDKRCHNDKKKDALYQQIFTKLSDSSLLATGVSVDKVTKVLKTTDVKSLIEYSRAVHAEMDAIISVARTHKAGLLHATLYTTTFPCHSCARHIVASGIKRVIFIEPYPKSLAKELHLDAISENEGDQDKKVLFLQYSGIAPKHILKLFNAGLTRKSTDGKLNVFDKKTAKPVIAVSLDDYPTHEKLVIAELAHNEKQAKGKQSTLFTPS